MTDRVIPLLADLVAIDSVNPGLVPGAVGEMAISQEIARVLKASGMDVEIQEATPGRPNVIGVVEGREPGRSLMWCGHMDTVGVIGMDKPFDPVRKNGRLYGRGSQDMKGGLAAMIDAAAHLSRNGSLRKGRVVLAAVIDEEFSSKGADALVTKWKADAAVVGEPTDLKIAVGHKGFSWVQLIVHGRAAHGSRPTEGRDAILRMGRVLGRLEALDREIQCRKAHPIHGTGSLHASFIDGGREWSTYPDVCTLKVERRTVGGEAPVIALEELQGIVKALKAEDPEFDAAADFVFSRPPYETPSGHAIPIAIEKLLRDRGRTPERGAMTFWTDAAILGEAGVPSVIFGPGGAGLHGIEEYVHEDEVIECRDVLIDLARDFC